MKDWKKITTTTGTPLKRVIQIIDSGKVQLAMVVDSEFHLLGTVTDGDIRRGIVNGRSLEDPVEFVMNSRPTSLQEDDGKEKILKVMDSKDISQVPIVNKNNVLVGLEVRRELSRKEGHDNWVVLMLGGLGSRLGDLTKDCPKPLLKVGERPLLEHIIERFVNFGFKKFYFSVNYKSSMIKEYFRDGSDWGIQIRYLDEDKRMGTAGSLSLITEEVTSPLIVMNGDLLTKIDFNSLVRYHLESRVDATMGVREYDFQLPFGVVKTDGTKIESVSEKPLQKFFVNAGVYVLNPSVLDFVPKESFQDMPDLFNHIIEQKLETSVFPIREYWLDIGRLDDFEKANIDFGENFK